METTTMEKKMETTIDMSCLLGVHVWQLDHLSNFIEGVHAYFCVFKGPLRVSMFVWETRGSLGSARAGAICAQRLKWQNRRPRISKSTNLKERVLSRDFCGIQVSSQGGACHLYRPLFVQCRLLFSTMLLYKWRVTNNPS